STCEAAKNQNALQPIATIRSSSGAMKMRQREVRRGATTMSVICDPLMRNFVNKAVGVPANRLTPFHGTMFSAKAPSRFSFLLGHDLRANATRLSRGKAASHLSGSRLSRPRNVLHNPPQSRIFQGRPLGVRLWLA